MWYAVFFSDGGLDAVAVSTGLVWKVELKKPCGTSLDGEVVAITVEILEYLAVIPNHPHAITPLLKPMATGACGRQSVGTRRPPPIEVLTTTPATSPTPANKP